MAVWERRYVPVIASAAKQSIAKKAEWIASLAMTAGRVAAYVRLFARIRSANRLNR